MDLLFLALISVVAGLLYVWWSSRRLPPNFPPGPRGLPVLGYTPFLSKALYQDFQLLSKRFGGIFHVPLGPRNAVVLNDWASIKEALLNQSETFSGRPIMFAADQVLNREDIVSSDGPLWKEKRRFALHHLRNLGVGKTSMEDIILEEVDRVMAIIDASAKGKVDVSEPLFIAILNIVWGIIAGRKYAYDDANMLTFSKTLKEVFDLFQRCLSINGYPVLRFLPGSPFPDLIKNNDKVLKFLRDEVEDHDRSYSEGTIRDFIDIYLSEIKAKGSKGGAFQKQHLVGTIYNFFTAGVETTHNTLLWSYLYMATWTEIQDKVQVELDRVIGRERLPTYSDRALLPYTEAVLLEIQRYVTVVPTSIPHTNTKDTKVQGYDIPMKTFIVQNIWSVHHDPKLWGDPEMFRPERFLSDDGKVQKPEYFIPFSLGARQCLGEALGKMELFLFFTSVLQRYELRIPTGERTPSFEPFVTITLAPQPYSLTFKRRQ